MRGLSRVGEWHGDYGQFLADALNDDAEREGVTDPGPPLVDRVDGRRCNDDGVRGGEDVGIVRVFVLAPHGMTGLLRQRRHIDELDRRWRGEQAGVPSLALRRSYQARDLPRGRGSAGDHVQDGPVHAVTLARPARALCKTSNACAINRGT